MSKAWVKSNIAVTGVSEDGSEIKHSFNNLKEGLTEEKITTFTAILNTLLADKISETKLTTIETVTK
ncbi:MAG: hypothetical protein ABF991_14615 [Liquorilactobacillus hordei]|uniref:DUF1659 domain-containing protein n=1 Tax=Liquorilactobacillus hordei DSM 19519 TaxID=1423759 RepID=A0A0R1MNW9_9LACO|nr:hypothetical protein [Liquorilactobacillus hordei]KRL07460.1 hypothetical protein FC92_GL001849 [Liquorilactobacillus hordei DSM 19519]MBZ2405233.1 hypothetical protein [Liquorilactobacillus hordei]QYH52226.1 hypothetical protein G6O70_07075 [Liquorilactobacillus hordei DSM 19519]